MANTISEKSVFFPTAWCAVREQEDRFLIYNPRTDEMHLISKTGFYLYQLCDGLRTLGEIEQDLSPWPVVEGFTARDGLLRFFAQLIERGILKEVDEHA